MLDSSSPWQLALWLLSGIMDCAGVNSSGGPQYGGGGAIKCEHVGFTTGGGGGETSLPS